MGRDHDDRAGVMDDVAPEGYWMALSDEWLSMDVDPSTSPEKLGNVLDAAAAVDGEIRKNRARIERLFGELVESSARAGVGRCAFYFAMVDGVLPVQAALTVAERSVSPSSNDVMTIFEGLSEDEQERTVDVVELDSGVAVRRTGRARERLPGSDGATELLSRQYYIPVPGSGDQIVVLGFTSPNTDLEEELSDLFDSVARSFVFTYGRRGRR